MKIQLLGCNHRSAPVELRERLAFDGDKRAQAIDTWLNRFPGVELVLLSTCNRVELYAAGTEETVPTADQLVEFLASFHGIPRDQFAAQLYCMANRDAVRHLFNVASSIDSLVPGEGQILGQVKEAYQLAMARNMTGPLTHPLFQRAIAVGKKVHSTTSIAQKKVSVSSVAVEFACEIFEVSHFPTKAVLVIGAGKMGELTLEHLSALKPGQILVTNRDPAKAQDVARRWKGRPMPFAELDDCLVEADLVISTTGSRDPLVDVARFRAIMHRRGNRPVFIVDIAVPRDFDPAISELENVYLYNIDDLERQRALNLEARQKEIVKGQAIVDREADLFLNEMAYQRHSGPVIQQLRREWDSVRENELNQIFAMCPEISEKDRRAIARGFERFQNQLLHMPLSTLRSACSNSENPPHGLLEALKRLFHLGQ